jgi:hypothetical protein
VFYRGIQSPAIDAVFARLCTGFKLTYAGPANCDPIIGKTAGIVGGINALRAKWHARTYLRAKLRHLVPEIDRFRARMVVTSVRHNSPQDRFLLAMLEAPDLILTADGVIVGPPQRFVPGSAERTALRCFGQPFPWTTVIRTPSYLAAFATKVGAVEVISDQTLATVFAEARAALAPVAPVGWRHVILGQHLALAGLTSELEEQRVWRDVFRHVSGVHRGARLLYKAHPRDRKMKRVLLPETTDPHPVTFTDEQNWAVPLEAMSMPEGTSVYGLSSSALLYAATLGKCRAVVVCSHSWPDMLVDEVTRFASETALPLEWVV